MYVYMQSICLEIFLVLDEVSWNEIGKKNIHIKGICTCLGISIYFLWAIVKIFFYKTKENLEAKTKKLGNTLAIS